MHDGSILATPVMPDPNAAIEPEDLYRKLMRDSDPAIRLRALDGYQKWLERQTRGCSACATREEADHLREATLDSMTPDEQAELCALIRAHQALKERIYTRLPDLRPLGSLPPTPAPVEPEAPPLSTDAAPPSVPPEDDGMDYI